MASSSLHRVATASPAGADEGFRVGAEQLEARGDLSDSHGACNALHLMGQRNVDGGELASATFALVSQPEFSSPERGGLTCSRMRLVAPITSFFAIDASWPSSKSKRVCEEMKKGQGTLAHLPSSRGDTTLPTYRKVAGSI